MRFNQGKGPLKIASELKMRGINTFDLSVFDWFQLAKEIRQRKFGDLYSLDFTTHLTSLGSFSLKEKLNINKMSKIYFIIKILF